MLKTNYSYYIVKDGKGKERLSSFINFNQAFRLIEKDKNGCFFDGIGMDIMFPLDNSYYQQWFPEIGDYVIDLSSLNENSFNISKIIDFDIEKNEYQIDGKILTLGEIQPYYGIVPNEYKSISDFNGVEYNFDINILCSNLTDEDISKDFSKEMVEASNNIDKLLKEKS